MHLFRVVWTDGTSKGEIPVLVRENSFDAAAKLYVKKNPEHSVLGVESVSFLAEESDVD